MQKLLIFVAFWILVLPACVGFKSNTMFDQSADKPEPPHIENFYALTVLKDKLNSEVWFTPNVECIKVTNSESQKFEGTSALHLKWDKQEGGCDWIGMGIGWDGWAPKDFSMIMNKAAIQFKAYSEGGRIKALPLAAAMEDYGGKQAWIGFASKYISYQPNEDWATITLPIGDFGWQEFGADETNVKQMIIQFEAAGDVYFDDIKVVPFEGTLDKIYTTSFMDEVDVLIDGTLDESIWAQTAEIESNRVAIAATPTTLFVSGSIKDDSPLMNSKSGDEVWNGDGIEIALSTNPEANPKRKTFLLSDQHFCIKMTENPMVWDYTAHKAIPNAEVQVVKTGEGYTFEASIPVDYFDMGPIKPNTQYKMEIAINQGNQEKRTQQLRWNSGGVEGFHTNPSLWGNITFKQLEN